jgi:hypothetical protein
MTYYDTYGKGVTYAGKYKRGKEKTRVGRSVDIAQFERIRVRPDRVRSHDLRAVDCLRQVALRPTSSFLLAVTVLLLAIFRSCRPAK